MIKNRSNSEYYQWGNNCEGWQLLFNKDLNVTYERMPPGTSEVKHYHRHARQFFFVLSGVATLEKDGEKLNIRPHEGVEVPPLVPHQMFNETNEVIQFLVISHPNHRGDREIMSKCDEQ